MNVSFSSPDIFINRAELAASMASRARTPVRKAARQCEALRSLIGAVTYDPFDGIPIVNLAFLKGELAGNYCPEAEMLPSPERLVEFAARVNSTGPEVLYSGAFLMSAAGERDLAIGLGRRLLSLEAGMPAQSPLELLRLLRQPQDLDFLLPRKLPVVVAWSHYLYSEGADRFNIWRSSLAAVQLEVVENAVQSEIRDPETRKLIERLIPIAANDEVRKSIDKYLSSSTGDAEARFFTERAKLNEHRVVRTIIQGDSTPLRGSLLDWGDSKSGALDYYYNSIGFFDSTSRTIRRIDLVCRNAPVSPLESLLRILVSSDNFSWSEITRQVRITASQDSGHYVVSIEVPAGVEWGPYWKVHFAAASRESNVSGALSSLLHVYGVQ